MKNVLSRSSGGWEELEHQQIQGLVRTHFLVHRWPSSPVSPHGQALGSLLGTLQKGALSHHEVSALMTYSTPRGPASKYQCDHWELGFIVHLKTKWSLVIVIIVVSQATSNCFYLYIHLLNRYSLDTYFVQLFSRQLENNTGIKVTLVELVFQFRETDSKLTSKYTRCQVVRQTSTRGN